MNFKEIKEIECPTEIEEDINIGIVTSLMRNYRNAIEAILELIDNAVDDKRKDCPIEIEIYLGKDFIQIRNTGGVGMDLGGIKSFLKWGVSSKRGKLGRYGQGGKAAMGYLGNAWKLKTSKLGSERTIIIEENNWRERIGGEKKKYRPKLFIGMVPKEKGEVIIEIKKLTRPINENKLRDSLSDFYRMLLEAGQIKIEINKNRVTPLEIPVERVEKISETVDGKEIQGWIGILKPNESFRGGIRCCVYGRKITENEYFGMPDYTKKSSLNRLIGEINGDFLELNLNKTGFDTDSYGWQSLIKIMSKKIEPYVKLLLEENEEEQITKDEKKRHKEASKTWNDFMRYYLKTGSSKSGEINKNDFDYGQKEPERNDLGSSENVESGIRGKYNPATPPPDDSVYRRKRLKRFFGIEARPGIINDIKVRSEFRKNKKEEVVIVNKLYPGYKMRKGDSVYIWETIAMESAKPEKEESMDYLDYIKEFNEIYSNFCIYLEKNKK